jgi:hypothetical protein
MAEALRLSWSAMKLAASIEIEYTVENDSDEHVFVLDEMYSGSPDGLQPTNQLIVLPGEGPGSIDLVAGFISLPGHKGAMYPTGARGVTREQKIGGKKTVPLPLKGWHPWSRALPPIDANATQFRLVLGYVMGPGAWSPQPLATGGIIRTLQIPYIVNKEKFLKGVVKTL